MTGEPPHEVRIRPVGDAALTVELGDAIDAELNARVRALDGALLERPFPGFVESVPAFCALLVCFDPERTSYEEAAAAMRALEGQAPRERETPVRHEIPVLYGGEDGPDLEAVALRTGVAPGEVIALHSGGDYTVFMLGFLRGFAYLGLVEERLEVPRLDTPRTRVPAGSVGIAGRLTSVYPAAVPGGWNLIGRASRRLFDPAREPPSLLRPGDHVRFVPVDRLEEEPIAPDPIEVFGPGSVVGPGRASPSIEVVEPGLFTTVQGAGRQGFRRFGVPTSGALDERALGRANAALGNVTNAAALECTIVGPALRFLQPTRFAVDGADLGARLERDDLGSWPVPLATPVLARAGNVLSFEGRRSGCRAYVAFAGGIDVPLVLGSRSTDLASGFGGFQGRPLAAGDRLSLLPARETARRGLASDEASAVSTEDTILGADATVRVVLGPQADNFTEVAREQFLSAAWAVRTTSDRVGLRLEGPALEHRGAREIPSDGMVPGSIQVPPDGQPIVMLADGPTTGGYPKIATVVRADLPVLAQLLPGASRVRFGRADSRVVGSVG